MKQSLFFLKALLVFIAFSSSIHANSVASTLGQISLASDHQQVYQNQNFQLILDLSFPKGWHSYWKNPGASGLPLSLDWESSEAVSIQDPLYLAPGRHALGSITNYGYKDSMRVLIPIKAPSCFSDQFTVTLNAEWLACKETCIPDSATVSVTIALGETAIKGALWDEARQFEGSLPPPFPGKSYFEDGGTQRQLFFSKSSFRDAPIRALYFFPEEPGIIDPDARQRLREERNLLGLSLVKESSGNFSRFSGILEVNYVDGTQEYFSLSIPAKMPYLVFLIKIMLFAFLGGLILNVMPCVFPILSLKALSLIKESSSEAKKDGIQYTLGVVSSFLVLAILLLILRAGGEELGWGFHLQSPIFVALLVLLFILIGAHLNGFLSLPQSVYTLSGKLAGTASQSGKTSGSQTAFWTGVLACIVATPCTAPLMAPAIGFALTQSTPVTLLIFTSLGLGMASPFLILGLFPQLAQMLPKPGPWMIRVKHGLAIPMYGTALWLFWVLSQESNTTGLALLGLSIASVFALHYYHQKRPLSFLMGLRLSILCLSPLYFLPQLAPTQHSALHSDPSFAQRERFSISRLEELIDQKTPVFVDVTAAWCLSCKYNERTAINTKTVQAYFKEKGIVTLIADWTNKDAEITEYLTSFNRIGVPLYVYYPVDKEPVILPQILTSNGIISSCQ